MANIAPIITGKVGRHGQCICQASAAIRSAVHWRHAPGVAALVVVAVLATVYAVYYHRWRKGWLSYRIEQSMREMRRSKAKPSPRATLMISTVRRLWRGLPHYSFFGTKVAIEYAVEDWRNNKLLQPTVTSFFLMLGVLLTVLFLPHWPSHLDNLWHPLSWWHELSSDLATDQTENVSHMFEGLIVVVIALIVFVAESIRSSTSGDERRVLLRLSKLWLLATLITLLPVAFIYPPTTELFVALTLCMVAFTVYGFARVLMNLLDPDGSLKEQRLLLRARIRNIVLASARQRVGNKLLFELLSEGKGGMRMAFSRSFLTGGRKSYVFIEAPQRGIIDDINIAGLEKLGRLLAGDARDGNELSAPGEAGGETRGPGSRRTLRGKGRGRPSPCLLRRFRDTISDDATFSDDFAIIAIPKTMAKPALVEEVRASLGTIFRFTKKEPPSVAFRNEMRSTKDRLLAAIKSAYLSEIEDLRVTYGLVAEEFLTTLNTLGGGYTAEQARRERNDWFESWDEVKWLTGDVRDLLKAAADTENTDVVRAVLLLPSTIMVRAFQAGDNLLYQQFTSFASYIYSLGMAQGSGAETRSVLIERSHRYLVELLDYYISPALREYDEDDE